MDYKVTLLVFGILLLLLGLVGKIKAKELEVGTSSTSVRIATILIGFVLMVASFNPDVITRFLSEITGQIEKEPLSKAEQVREEDVLRKAAEAHEEVERLKAEQVRVKEENLRAEQARVKEENRRAERARVEVERLKAEQARVKEELRRAAEANEEVERFKAEQVRVKEELRKAAEVHEKEEHRRAEQARVKEEHRRAEQARVKEELRIAEQARVEIERLIAAEEKRKTILYNNIWAKSGAFFKLEGDLRFNINSVSKSKLTVNVSYRENEIESASLFVGDTLEFDYQGTFYKAKLNKIGSAGIMRWKLAGFFTISKK